MFDVSEKAATLQGSEIIKLGNEINRRISEGHSIYNLTIGDFNPKLFPIPTELKDYIIQAYENGQTNYPPADGMKELKRAVLSFSSAHGNLPYNDDEIVIASGGRPLIYSIYQAILDPNDLVIYPVPSWNNNHYCHLSSARKAEFETSIESGFMPNAHQMEPWIQEASLIALCSPLNPSGTVFTQTQLIDICQLVLKENKRRTNKKPLYVLFDQMYWLLRSGDTEHVDPVSLVPEMKAYTIYVDGISKSFAATGVRVGWSLGPKNIIQRLKSILGHIGAWAPRPEQVATAMFIENNDALHSYLNEMKIEMQMRFDGLYKGILQLKNDGLPINIIAPQGAIYISVQFQIIGKETASGKKIESTEDISNFLLNEAHVAMVPFTAFGVAKGTDWFRVSLGTLAVSDIEPLLDSLKKALLSLK